MKRHLLIFCIISFVFISSAKACDADSVLIRFVDWDIEHPNTASYCNFEREVPYKEFLLPVSRPLTGLMSKIAQLEEVPDVDFQVACKLLCIKQGQVLHKICMNKQYVLIDGVCKRNTADVVNIVNIVMDSGIEKSNTNRFLSDYFGNEYTEGWGSLSHKLDTLLHDSLLVKQTVRMSAHLKADKNGNTTATSIQVYSEALSHKEIAAIREKLHSFFLHSVKWKKEPMRMKKDWIYIVYKYSFFDY
ncbi:MAG: hypothetical protein HUK07_02905 [Bacteroidaceae bacterium]|nr:hypothetical protein [Bacteroidaceae bacterium]